jgi:hypothetical protein
MSKSLILLFPKQNKTCFVSVSEFRDLEIFIENEVGISPHEQVIFSSEHNIYANNNNYDQFGYNDILNVGDIHDLKAEIKNIKRAKKIKNFSVVGTFINEGNCWETDIIIDTGAQLSVISLHLAQKYNYKINTGNKKILHGVNGRKENYGSIYCDVFFKKRDNTFILIKMQFIVTDTPDSTMVLIGQNILHNFEKNFKNNYLEYRTHKIHFIDNDKYKIPTKVPYNDNLCTPHIILPKITTKYVFWISAIIWGIKFSFLVDSGSELNIIDKKLYSLYFKNNKYDATTRKIMGVNEVSESNGELSKVKIVFGVDNIFEANVDILDTNSENNNDNFNIMGVLGYDFLKNTIIKNDKLYLRDETVIELSQNNYRNPIKLVAEMKFREYNKYSLLKKIVDNIGIDEKYKKISISYLKRNNYEDMIPILQSFEFVTENDKLCYKGEYEILKNQFEISSC